jgi:predicted enzyme related to lactoylglutathione lyase
MARGDVSHIDLTVSNVQSSHAFYDSVLKFLGFVGHTTTRCSSPIQTD